MLRTGILVWSHFFRRYAYIECSWIPPFLFFQHQYMQEYDVQVSNSLTISKTNIDVKGEVMKSLITLTKAVIDQKLALPKKPSVDQASMSPLKKYWRRNKARAVQKAKSSWKKIENSRHDNNNDAPLPRGSCNVTRPRSVPDLFDLCFLLLKDRGQEH